MKIVYLLATNEGWGGLEKHVFDVASAMASRGHDVVVLCSESYKKYCPPNVIIDPFKWSGSRRNPFLWFKLRHKLKLHSPDVVHAQADKPAYALCRAGWPDNCLAVGTVHNIKSSYASYTKLDELIAVSGMIAAQLNHPNVSVIHNGVLKSEPDERGVAQLKSWMIEKPAPVVLAVGRLVAAKGFDLLLRAWPMDSLGTLVVLGEGKDRGLLENIIVDRNLKNVHLLGESYQVREWIEVSDILVISSRNEGGPYVLSEALINGLPVIGTRVGMVPDYLPEDNLIPPDDIDALRVLLESVLRDPARFKCNCQDAMGDAERNLSVRAMMDAVEGVYKKRKGLR